MRGLLDLFRADHIAKLNFRAHLKLAKVYVFKLCDCLARVFFDFAYVKLLGLPFRLITFIFLSFKFFRIVFKLLRIFSYQIYVTYSFRHRYQKRNSCSYDIIESLRAVLVREYKHKIIIITYKIYVDLYVCELISSSLIAL